MEGWHVIAEANRISGYDASWDRRTLASPRVWSGAKGAYHEAAYTAKVRVSVRPATSFVREGSGNRAHHQRTRTNSSKEHFVAQRPCLICGRAAPSHAHHIHFAQSRGLG